MLSRSLLRAPGFAAFAVVLLYAFLAAAPARAELEISGNITALTVYQHDDKDAGALGAGGATMGDLGVVDCANCDHFRFLVEQVELDLENEFGDKIRARADLDFRDVAGTNIRAADMFDLEQGFVTANLGVGNGMEFLIGKFNSPVGLEANDRDANVFVTYTPGYQYLVPASVIGAKIYYEFNDHVNFDIAAVNNLNGPIVGNSAYPSGIVRLGFFWGDRADPSYVHIGGGFGPEWGNIAATSQNKHLDLFAHACGNFAIGSLWDIGWEGMYRQTNAIVAGGQNQKAVAGQLYGQWHVSDLWSLQARGAALWDVNPVNAAAGIGASTTDGTWGGFEGLTYSGTAGATYNVADNAKVSLEYRFDFAATAGPANNADYHTGAVQFAYNF